MSLSYFDVFALDQDESVLEEIRAGDLVRTGPNHHPHYTVIAVSGDKAWVRNVETGADSLAPTRRCRRLTEALALAAE